MRRAGLAGGLAAWVGFTGPSALAMVLFAYGVGWAGAVDRAPWLHGLKLVAVAVVAQAVWGMARSLLPGPAACDAGDRRGGAGAGPCRARAARSARSRSAPSSVFGWSASRFCPLPARLRPWWRRSARRCLWSRSLRCCSGCRRSWKPAIGGHALALLERFYRAGALVFGGGHVVLPLLQQAVVPPGWIDNSLFLAGYGAAQAVPGPLFSFAAYLGAAMAPAPNGWVGALLCLVAIYLPSLLLLVGVLPFWDGLRRRAPVRAALRGVNAAVVGVLLAALYTPVWTSAVGSPAAFALVCAAFLALVAWRAPPWLVVLAGALAASGLGWAGVPV